VISDGWDGLERFFVPGKEILVADDAQQVVRYLTEIGEEERRAIGERARRRVLAEHTAERRAEELETYAHELAGAAA
jgi:spore maturation protein CgeB